MSSRSKENNTHAPGLSTDVPSMAPTALALPVEVVAEKLADGWSAASPIFYPPRLAAIYISQTGGTDDGTVAGKGDILLMCDGPLPCLMCHSTQTQDPLSFFTQYLQETPLLHSAFNSGAEMSTLSEAGLSCESMCFTHIAVIPSEKMTIVLGRNGPYVLSLLLMQHVFLHKREEKGGITTDALTANDIQMLLDACSPVPLVDGLRLPATPAGCQRGSLRVTCRRGEYMVVFSVSTIISVRRSVGEKESGNKNGDSALFTLEGEVLPKGKICISGATLEALVKRRATIDALFPGDSPDCLPVSSHVSLLAVEEFCSSTKSAGGVDGAANMRGEDEDVLSIVFCHPQLGVSFSVEPRTGVVREPILTDDLLVLYYPLGDESRDSDASNSANNITSPRVSIRRVTRLPQTWKRALSSENELKHSVLFHFTEWTKTRVPCSVSQFNDFMCVQLYEEKEGWKCRSYVVPFEDAALVVRWETESEEWDAHLPLLQKFVDTLHVSHASD